jgi:hypothetical protein
MLTSKLTGSFFFWVSPDYDLYPASIFFAVFFSQVFAAFDNLEAASVCENREVFVLGRLELRIDLVYSTINGRVIVVFWYLCSFAYLASDAFYSSV